MSPLEQFKSKFQYPHGPMYPPLRDALTTIEAAIASLTTEQIIELAKKINESNWTALTGTSQRDPWARDVTPK